MSGILQKNLLCLHVQFKWDFTTSVLLEDLISSESIKLKRQLLLSWFKVGTAARGGSSG